VSSPVPKPETFSRIEFEDGIPVIQHGLDALSITSKMVDKEYLHSEPRT
jgi:hypothetical protein